MPMQPSPSAETVRPPSCTCFIVRVPLVKAIWMLPPRSHPAALASQYRDLPGKIRARLRTPGGVTVKAMSTPNALGEFLRAHREQLRPEDAGLEVTGRRRTPGLRREEVALLAGISTDYYLRL